MDSPTTPPPPGAEAGPAAPGAAGALPEVLAGLSVQLAECVLRLDRPTALRPLATTTIRGLAGHALAAEQPRLVRPCFKPGQHSHLPPACLFQPVLHQPSTGDQLPFRLIAWDPDGRFLPGQLAALERARGRPFGEGGSRVAGFHLAGLEKLEFCGLDPAPAPVRLAFLTPVALKHRKAWVDASTITLAHLCLAMARRLNALSQCYGNGLQLDPAAFLAQAALTRGQPPQLRWVSPCRRSSTQDSDLSLAGLVGWMDFPPLPGPLLNLLALAAVFHLGYHTAVGAGLLQAVPLPPPPIPLARPPQNR